MRTPQPVNPRRLGASQVVVRFGLRLAFVAAFATAGHEGYAATLSEFLVLTAVCCAALATVRREAMFGPILTHWDEAAVYAVIGRVAATFA